MFVYQRVYCFLFSVTAPVSEPPAVHDFDIKPDHGPCNCLMGTAAICYLSHIPVYVLLLADSGCGSTSKTWRTADL
jgi:hypothetical protein